MNGRREGGKRRWISVWVGERRVVKFEMNIEMFHSTGYWVLGSEKYLQSCGRHSSAYDLPVSTTAPISNPVTCSFR
jgi:hypothetical protein